MVELFRKFHHFVFKFIVCGEKYTHITVYLTLSHSCFLISRQSLTYSRIFTLYTEPEYYPQQPVSYLCCESSKHIYT
jgi:hypothetical protein